MFGVRDEQVAILSDACCQAFKSSSNAGCLQPAPGSEALGYGSVPHLTQTKLAGVIFSALCVQLVCYGLAFSTLLSSNSDQPFEEASPN